MNRRVPIFFNDADSFFHRRDPRVKWITLALVMVFIYTAPTWEWMAAGALLGAAMVVVARVPPKWIGFLLLLQIPQVATFLAFPAVARMLSGQGAFAGNFDFALKVTLSWQVALFFGASIFTSMELTDVTDGLRALGVPELVVFTIEYTFLLFYITLSDLFRIMDAMKVKGIAIETKNPITLARNLPKLGIPMLFALLRRSNTMIAVLKMRGYSFTETPELRAQMKFDAGDAVLLLAAVSAAGVTLAVRFGFVESPMPVLGLG